MKQPTYAMIYFNTGVGIFIDTLNVWDIIRFAYSDV